MSYLDTDQDQTIDFTNKYNENVGSISPKSKKNYEDTHYSSYHCSTLYNASTLNSEPDSKSKISTDQIDLPNVPKIMSNEVNSLRNNQRQATCRSASLPLDKLITDPAESNLVGQITRIRRSSYKTYKPHHSLDDDFEEDDKYSYLFEANDYMNHYETENTPICFSNDSPLSSLSFEMLSCEPQSTDEEQFSSNDCMLNYYTEGTPICFSHDSPLSSLSLNLSFEKQDLQSILGLQRQSSIYNRSIAFDNRSVRSESRLPLSKPATSVSLLPARCSSLKSMDTALTGPVRQALTSSNSSIIESLDNNNAGIIQNLSCSPKTRKSTFGQLIIEEEFSESKPILFNSQTKDEKLNVTKSEESEVILNVQHDLNEKANECTSKVQTKLDQENAFENYRQKDECKESEKFNLNLLNKTDFEKGFDENDDEEFYLNQCITSGRSMVKEKLKYSDKLDKLSKFDKLTIQPNKSKDYELKVDMYHSFTKKDYYSSKTRSFRPCGGLNQVRVKTAASVVSDNCSEAISNFSQKYISRSKYKIDGEESGLVSEDQNAETSLPTITENTLIKPGLINQQSLLSNAKQNENIATIGSKKKGIKKLFSIFKINH